MLAVQRASCLGVSQASSQQVSSPRAEETVSTPEISKEATDALGDQKKAIPSLPQFDFPDFRESLSTLPDRTRQLARELPQNLSSVPGRTADFARDLPSNLSALPDRTRDFTKDISKYTSAANFNMFTENFSLFSLLVSSFCNRC